MPGTQVRVIDATGRPLGPNAEGELVARGPGIFAGYEDNPAATAAAFIDGFFRTGDLARYDDDGFFYLTGRIKEQINRGGTKVSPYEVEDALLTHPDVVQAVAFATPDPVLGDEVACAVVLREGAAPLNELDVQRHVAPHLADHKVPRRVVFVDEVPAGPNGKVVRRTLAEQLGITRDASARPAGDAATPYNEPVTPTEQTLAAVWSEVLGRRVGDVDAPFETLGVDSLQAMKISLAIEQRFGRAVPLAALSTRRTIRAAAALLESDGWRPEPGAPVVLREGRPGPPVLFVLPGIGGNVYSYYALAQRLPEWQRVVGLPLPGADGLEPPVDSLLAVADRFTAAVLHGQPRGPYLLCGYSFGGRAAFEVARRLVASGCEVKLLAMFDTPAPGWPPPLKLPDRVAMHWGRVLRDGPGEALRRAAGRLLGSGPKAAAAPSAVPAEVVEAQRLDGAPRAGSDRQDALLATYQAAADGWKPEPFNVRVSLMRAEVPIWTDCDLSDPTMGWAGLAAGGVDVTVVPGKHGTLFHGYNMAHIAGRIAELIG
jgi:thioesterase domain-containing protein/acyl carrier protein